MKAILTGSLSDGFKIESISHDDEAAENAIIKILANGKLAEAIDIKDPSQEDADIEAVENGTLFVVAGSASNGLQVWGPFDDHEEANGFAEWCFNELPWEIFEAEAPKFLYTPLGRAWGHIFTGKTDTMCRFAYDMTQEKLVYLDLLSDNRWTAASAQEALDLEDSLKNANAEIFERPESFGLVLSLTPPDWLDAESRERLLAKPAVGGMKP